MNCSFSPAIEWSDGGDVYVRFLKDMSDDEIASLEEPHVPHAIVGVMAQNKPSDADKEHVWLANANALTLGGTTA